MAQHAQRQAVHLPLDLPEHGLGRQAVARRRSSNPFDQLIVFHAKLETGSHFFVTQILQNGPAPAISKGNGTTFFGSLEGVGTAAQIL
jgi:hypothetical protein